MLFLLALLFLIELGYLYIADRYNIIDKPNQRSSHTRPTIRGGGIIFPIAWLLHSAWTGWSYPWFTAGVVLISTVSFWDDLRPVSARIRLLVHVAAFTLLFVELDAFGALPWWGIVLAYVLGIGIINAYNFMDGINGITGMYTLSILLPFTLIQLMFILTALYYIPFLTPEENRHMFFDIENGIIGMFPHCMIPAVVVFGYFNFRKKARCFAGDVGSVSLGFIVFFLLLSVFLGKLNDAQLPAFDGKYILFLAVYGVDSVLTIVYRLWLGENIFQAHRKHLYQYLANERRWPHLVVAGLYAGVQLIINVWVLLGPVSVWSGIVLLAVLAGLYYWLHFYAFRTPQSGRVEPEVG
jgi:UDP-N-acetylmuramyl pentapeptide phosphotransferase/UDP-N-acetylglucosamine-1-phosphate transferase